MIFTLFSNLHYGSTMSMDYFDNQKNRHEIIYTNMYIFHYIYLGFKM